MVAKFCRHFRGNEVKLMAQLVDLLTFIDICWRFPFCGKNYGRGYDL